MERERREEKWKQRRKWNERREGEEDRVIRGGYRRGLVGEESADIKSKKDGGETATKKCYLLLFTTAIY